MSEGLPSCRLDCQLDYRPTGVNFGHRFSLSLSFYLRGRVTRNGRTCPRYAQHIATHARAPCTHTHIHTHTLTRARARSHRVIAQSNIGNADMPCVKHARQEKRCSVSTRETEARARDRLYFGDTAVAILRELNVRQQRRRRR